MICKTYPPLSLNPEVPFGSLVNIREVPSGAPTLLIKLGSLGTEPLKLRKSKSKFPCNGSKINCVCNSTRRSKAFVPFVNVVNALLRYNAPLNTFKLSLPIF